VYGKPHHPIAFVPAQARETCLFPSCGRLTLMPEGEERAAGRSAPEPIAHDRSTLFPPISAAGTYSNLPLQQLGPAPPRGSRYMRAGAPTVSKGPDQQLSPADSTGFSFRVSRQDRLVEAMQRVPPGPFEVADRRYRNFGPLRLWAMSGGGA